MTNSIAFEDFRRSVVIGLTPEQRDEWAAVARSDGYTNFTDWMLDTIMNYVDSGIDC